MELKTELKGKVIGMKQLELLYRLQEIESCIEMEQQKLKELQRPKQINKNIEEHKKVKATLENNKNNMIESNKALKMLESDMEDLESKADELKVKMYDGKINDLKQLGVMLKEQEKIEGKSKEISDEMETKMQEMESLNNKIDNLKKTDKEMYTAIRQMLKERNENKKQGESQLKQLMVDKEKVLSKIDPKNLERYHYIKSKKNNPIAVLDGNICSGCHMDLPIMTITSLKRKEIVTYSNCGRILYRIEG